MSTSNETFEKALAQRKAAVTTALFEYLFLAMYGRLPSYWEARLGEAIVSGELTVNREPTAIGLRQVHQVAAEVADALTAQKV